MEKPDAGEAPALISPLTAASFVRKAKQLQDLLRSELRFIFSGTSRSVAFVIRNGRSYIALNTESSEMFSGAFKRNSIQSRSRQGQ